MRYLEKLGNSSNMTAHRSTTSTQRPSSTTSDDSLVHINQAPDLLTSPPASDFENISPSSSAMTGATSSTSTASAPNGKAKLLYCKSHVAIHPTQFNKDNISGYLGIVEADGSGVHTDQDGVVAQGNGKELLVTWVPDELLQRMDAQDIEGYKRVEDRLAGSKPADDFEEDGFVFVTVPPPKGEKYAFSVPLSTIYSILVYPPSLQHWYGSATLNLNGGVSLPTLFFHDDESPLLTNAASNGNQQRTARSQWGFPPFLTLLQSHASVLRSRLLSSKAYGNAELWLINPSKADREVHEAGIENEPADVKGTTTTTSGSTPYPPPAQFPDSTVLDYQPTPKQAILSSLSNITSFSRRVSAQILAHPLAKEVVPHLPPAVRSFVNAPGEWNQPGARSKRGKSDVANEFESARLYLARWARVVAEEGERARRDEVAGRAGLGDSQSDVDDLASSLGVFSLLSSPNSKRPTPHPTRDPKHPINSQDWHSLAAQGRDETFVRREIFRRGFSDSPEPAAKLTRREGWEVLLGIVPWSVGGVGGGDAAMASRKKAREDYRQKKREEYATLLAKWNNDESLKEQDGYKEEWHRIDVDCRRTDRQQPIFAIPTEIVKQGDAEKEPGGPSYDAKSENEGEVNGSARLNPHIAALRTILMTYHIYRPELGYVQGMSDLLSPIYVVFGANEADAFWGLVGVMKEMESNFLRDQSGMKRQLSTLQQLIGVMDPELYAHLDRTGSLNLFFCFRWILIAFKREFKFEDVIRLWEVLWTDYYSDQFVLFVALAVLQSHRDVLIRYLTEFDEVLKYANDLSGTIDLDTTLAQAEVLFLQFRGMVADYDQEKAASEEAAGGLRKRKGSAPAAEGEASAAEVKDQKREISPDLRDLLQNFKSDEEE